MNEKLEGGYKEVIKLPESASIPFKMAEYTIGLHADVHDEYSKLIQKLKNSMKYGGSETELETTLDKLKNLILNMEYNETDPHHQFLQEQLIQFGIPSDQFGEAWTSIKKVWASKFNERALVATNKLGLSIDQIYMAVLVQRVIPADYAYVIHTVNPMTGNE